MIRSTSLILSAALAMTMASCSSDPAPAASGDDDSGATTTPSDDSGTVTDAPAETAPVDVYPAGPYGFKPTQVFPDIKLHVLKDGDVTKPFVDETLAKYYDPDGSKGLTAIYLDSSAVWCPHCMSESKAMPNAYAKNYKDRGVHIIAVLVQAVNPANPATERDAINWSNTYHSNYDMGIDPTYLTFVWPHPDAMADIKAAAAKLSIGFPTNYVIDPRTMKVFRRIAGADDYVWKASSQAGCCLMADPRCTGSESPGQDYVYDSVEGLCVGWDGSTSVGYASPFPDLDLLIAKNHGKPGPALPPAPPVYDSGIPDDTGSASDGGGATDATTTTVEAAPGD